VPGQEKFAFLYVVISIVAVACATTYSWIAHLAWWLGLPLAVLCVIAGWAVVFSFLEVRRLAQSPTARAEEAGKFEPNIYAPRALAVRPETGDATVHHEFYAESQGFDQGQLTSQLPDTTPFIDRFLSRRSKKPA